MVLCTLLFRPRPPGRSWCPCPLSSPQWPSSGSQWPLQVYSKAHPLESSLLLCCSLPSTSSLLLSQEPLTISPSDALPPALKAFPCFPARWECSSWNLQLSGIASYHATVPSLFLSSVIHCPCLEHLASDFPQKVSYPRQSPRLGSFRSIAPKQLPSPNTSNILVFNHLCSSYHAGTPWLIC